MNEYNTVASLLASELAANDPHDSDWDRLTRKLAHFIAEDIRDNNTEYADGAMRSLLELVFESARSPFNNVSLPTVESHGTRWGTGAIKLLDQTAALDWCRSRAHFFTNLIEESTNA